jgi:hypothetical protein
MIIWGQTVVLGESAKAASSRVVLKNMILDEKKIHDASVLENCNNLLYDYYSSLLVVIIAAQLLVASSLLLVELLTSSSTVVGVNTAGPKLSCRSRVLVQSLVQVVAS